MSPEHKVKLYLLLGLGLGNHIINTFMVMGPLKIWEKEQRLYLSMGKVSKSQSKKGMWDGRHCCGCLCKTVSHTRLDVLPEILSMPLTKKKKERRRPASHFIELSARKN